MLQTILLILFLTLLGPLQGQETGGIKSPPDVLTDNVRQEQIAYCQQQVQKALQLQNEAVKNKIPIPFLEIETIFRQASKHVERQIFLDNMFYRMKELAVSEGPDCRKLALYCYDFTVQSAKRKLKENAPGRYNALELLMVQRELALWSRVPELKTLWLKNRRQNAQLWLAAFNQQTACLSPENVTRLGRQWQKLTDFKEKQYKKIRFQPPNGNGNYWSLPPPDWVVDENQHKEYQDYYDNFYDFQEKETHRRQIERQRPKLADQTLCYLGDLYGTKPFADAELKLLMQKYNLDEEFQKKILTAVSKIQNADTSFK